jgi:hypothetical protein
MKAEEGGEPAPSSEIVPGIGMMQLRPRRTAPVEVLE